MTETVATIDPEVRYVLVRHSQPETVATTDPARWVLSRSGRVAAATLTDRLPAGAHLAASTETKAIQTIVLAAGVRMDQVQCDRRFDEVCRPGEPFDNQHQERRLAWVRSELDDRHRGWETPEQAAERFHSGVESTTADTTAATVVIGSHGMIMTAWLVAIGHLRAGDAAGYFWLGLGFPDIVAVTRRSRGPGRQPGPSGWARS